MKKLQQTITIGNSCNLIGKTKDVFSPVKETITKSTVNSEKVTIEKIRYENGKILVNQEFHFENVHQTAWYFYIGGYQPAQKWFKSQKGCILKAEDIRYYWKIILALTRTAELMGEIDKAEVV